MTPSASGNVLSPEPSALRPRPSWKYSEMAYSVPRKATEARTMTPLPIVDLRLLRNRLFRSGNGVMVLASVAFLGTLYAISLYFQDGRGLSALGSGLSTFPEALGVM